MSKRILIEANVFAKLLSFFYDAKDKGKEDALAKFVNSKNSPELNRAYDAWQRDNEKLLLSTKKLLIGSGLDTSKIDSLLKKYHNY